MLNGRQERFCLEYIIDSNATQAAIRAGYSEKTAYSIGQRLMKHVEVRARVDELLAEIKSSKIADATEVLETLTRVLRREEPENVVVTVKKHKSWYDDNGKKMIQDDEEAQVVTIPAKVSDVNKAGELLAKKYGLLTERDDLTGAVMVVINYDYGPDD